MLDHIERLEFRLVLPLKEVQSHFFQNVSAFNIFLIFLSVIIVFCGISLKDYTIKENIFTAIWLWQKYRPEMP